MNVSYVIKPNGQGSGDHCQKMGEMATRVKCVAMYAGVS